MIESFLQIFRAALLAVLFLAVPALPAQSLDRTLLNSERIEQTFGSYGIEVLVNEPAERVSRLYSVHDGIEICRTFAVVIYPNDPPPVLAGAHAEIVAGGSIGATLARAGWLVQKTDRFLGTVPPTPGLLELMRIDHAEELAIHIYVLSAARNGTAFDYATIAEIHHPDYLGIFDLELMYGIDRGLPTEADDSIRPILERVAARLP